MTEEPPQGGFFVIWVFTQASAPVEGGAGGTRPRKRGSGHTPKRPAPKHHAQAAKGRARPARP